MAWRPVRANDVDRSAPVSVGAGPFPVRKVEILILDPVSRLQLELRPMAVKVERVGILVADEIGEGALPHRPVAPVGLDHEHLVAVDGIYLVVGDVVDILNPMSAFSALLGKWISYQC